MSEKTKVKKLLRVLVAGGVALAGVSGVRADEGTPAPSEKMDKAEKPTKGGDKDKKKEKGDKKKGNEKKAEGDSKSSEGGGVQGW